MSQQRELFDALRGLYGPPSQPAERPSQPAERPSSARCSACGGDDQASPCAYPGEGLPGCLRAARLALARPGSQPVPEAASAAPAAGATLPATQTYAPSTDGHPEPQSMMRGRLLTARRVKDFATAGHAILTVRSLVTGTRYTFKVRQPKNDQQRGAHAQRPIWFVSVLSGPDNNTTYSYLGQVRQDMTYDHGRKSKIAISAPSAKAFDWFWRLVRAENDAVLFKNTEVWHEGRCGRCGRRLTVPESIESGFGPDCIQVMLGGRS